MESRVEQYVQYYLNEGNTYSFYDEGTQTWKFIIAFNIITYPKYPDDTVISFYENRTTKHNVNFKRRDELLGAIAKYTERKSGATPSKATTTGQQWHALGKLADLLVHLSAHA
jgi:hypothetical protein